MFNPIWMWRHLNKCIVFIWIWDHAVHVYLNVWCAINQINALNGFMPFCDSTFKSASSTFIAMQKDRQGRISSSSSSFFFSIFFFYKAWIGHNFLTGVVKMLCNDQMKLLSINLEKISFCYIIFVFLMHNLFKETCHQKSSQFILVTVTTVTINAHILINLMIACNIGFDRKVSGSFNLWFWA